MAGSIIKKPNNKWELRVSVGYDENSKQKRVTKVVYAKTKKEAEKLLAEFYLEIKSTIVVDHEISFEEFTKLLKLRHYNKLSPITVNRYNQLLDNRLIPAFGKMKLKKMLCILK